MKNITIYSDIDEVIHDFRTPFYEAINERFNIKISNETMPSENDLKKPLNSRFGIKEEDFEDLIEELNNLKQWIPTSFAFSLISFLKKRKRKGDKSIFVTARSSRNGARHIIQEAFDEDFPIIQCDAIYKKHVVRDGCLFFEDRGDTIESCSETNPNSLIVAPEWPWNSYLKKLNLNNVRVYEQDVFSIKLDEINNLLDFKNGELNGQF